MIDVVLDENVYIRALESECTGDREDERAAHVVFLVQDRHRWLFTHAVVAAYYHQFSNVRCKGSTPTRLIMSLNDMFVDGQRFDYIEDADVVPGEYDVQDQHVVAAAASRRGALLITLDMRLRQALDLAGIPDQYGFQVVDVMTAEMMLLAD